jgi:hypothetical protein
VPGKQKIRPRGFVEKWNPRAHTRVLLDQVNDVLADYADQLPLTIRQVFYRLVGVYQYEKSERAYNRLSEMLATARRARVISMDDIRDDGFVSKRGLFYDDLPDFLETMMHLAKNLRLDRMVGQSRRIVVWCEATGMVPLLERIAEPYGIEVCSSGGFDPSLINTGSGKNGKTTRSPSYTLAITTVPESGSTRTWQPTSAPSVATTALMPNSIGWR